MDSRNEADLSKVRVVGTSCSGKTTLARRLMAAHPEFQISISHTTRRPRQGESHGVEYYFVSDATFDAMTEMHQFVEHAGVQK